MATCLLIWRVDTVTANIYQVFLHTLINILYTVTYRHLFHVRNSSRGGYCCSPVFIRVKTRPGPRLHLSPRVTQPVSGRARIQAEDTRRVSVLVHLASGWAGVSRP